MNTVASEVIIIGGGPAGAACAFELNRHGIDTLILEKRPFPRIKPCAGWLPPRVFDRLEIRPDEYPGDRTVFDRLIVHLKGLRFSIDSYQHAIRRVEFDHWLLQRSGAKIITHKAQKIVRENDAFLIDGQYLCKYLVGTGGTHCPVYKTFFGQLHPRSSKTLITTIEEEFSYPYNDHDCHLWFFEKNLPGYAWYVPKKGGYVNAGIGGAFLHMKRNNTHIRMHWDRFIQKLQTLRLVTNHRYRPRGYNYYLRQPDDLCQSGPVYIAGDAAGLATLDMGEGIGPAIESGQAVAHAIIHSTPYSPRAIEKFSGPSWLSVPMSKLMNLPALFPCTVKSLSS